MSFADWLLVNRSKLFLNSIIMIHMQMSIFKCLKVLEYSLNSSHEILWKIYSLKNTFFRASLVMQWLRIHLPMQGTRVRALVREYPTCHGATKPMCHNYWACALEPASYNYWSPHDTTTEACMPRACALQQEKPLQWEARAPQWRVAPCRHS